MSSKKYKLLLAVFLLLTSGVIAQKSTSGYDVYDSTVITSKRQPQQNEFWNNSYNFPSKPRNMWEIGISGGVFNVIGDVDSKLPTLGFAAHVRKAFGYVFSLRLQYLNGTAIGQNWKASGNYAKNTAWSSTYSAPDRRGLIPTTTIPGQAEEYVFYNYKTKLQDLSLQGIVTLNNIRFHKNKTGFVMYGGAGVGGTIYETKVNARNESAGTDYSDLFTAQANVSGEFKNRKDIRKALKDGQDDTYETAAETLGDKRATIGDQTFRFSTTVLAGIAFKLGRRINIALENRHTFVKDDLLDGQQWQEHPVGDATLTSNWDSYNYLSLGLNFNIGAKSVEPLWWLNPLDYVYGEVNNPRHTKFPKPTFDDADGDGVLDQLDREPNTPAGCPVDSHGVTQDTDGDGVPDCKDKQLITPTECQPVDADGVGKCPDPECCKNRIADSATVVCPTDYPSLSFKGNSLTLSRDTKAMLASVAAKMKANPTCNININGYPEASKASQAVCQKRVDAVKMYLVQTEGISADRITTNCEVGGGDKNTIDIKSN
jgi:outer membrane protein OmpA-like peptidoglycan-associated protein/opacity protein-like surface antigen